MNPFVQWLMSPLSQWHLTSLGHKLVAGVVGAAVGYYLYTKKYPNWQVAVGSVGAAYIASLAMNAAGKYALPAPQQISQSIPAQPAEVEQEGIDIPMDDFDEEGEGIFG